MSKKGKRLIGPHPLLILFTMGIPYFLIHIHRSTGGSISDILQNHFAVGTTSVALLASTYLYAYTAMQIPAGLVVDRIGPRRCISFFLIMIAFGTFLCAYSAEVRDFNLMILGKVTIGTCAALVIIPGLKAIAMWFSKDKLATADGIFMFIGNVGGIFAAAPMVFMLESVGITGTYLLMAALILMASGICWIVVHDHSSEPVVQEQTRRKIGSFETLKMIVTSGRGFWVLVLFALSHSCTMVWVSSQAGAFYCSVYDFSLSEAGTMVSLFSIGVAIACPLSGFLADSVFHSGKKVLIISSIMIVSVWSVIMMMTYYGLFNNIMIQGAINVLLGFSAGSTVVEFAVMRRLFPIEIAGTTISLLNSFSFFGGATLIAISGFIIPNKSVEEYMVLWSIMLMFFIFAMILSFFIEEHRDPVA